jgi:hypothetical protein
VSPVPGCNELPGCWHAYSSHTHEQAWDGKGIITPKQWKKKKKAVESQAAYGEIKFQLFHSNNLRPQELMT